MGKPHTRSRHPTWPQSQDPTQVRTPNRDVTLHPSVIYSARTMDLTVRTRGSTRPPPTVRQRPAPPPTARQTTVPQERGRIRGMQRERVAERPPRSASQSQAPQNGASRDRARPFRASRSPAPHPRAEQIVCAPPREETMVPERDPGSTAHLDLEYQRGRMGGLVTGTARDLGHGGAPAFRRKKNGSS